MAELGHKALSLRDDAQDHFASQRRAAEKQLSQARRDAEKELRRARKNWNPEQLEREVGRRVAPLSKQLDRDLARFQKQAAKKGREVQARFDPEPRGGVSGGVVTLALLGTTAVVLARVPAARQGLLKAVESVNPQWAESLHQAGRTARNLVGSMWLERLEEPGQAPNAGVAKSTQGATTGATWGATPSPTSDAAAKPAQAPADAGKPGAGQTDAAKTDAPKTDSDKKTN